MLVFAKSDIGLIRQTNEDSYACIHPDLYLVADGMGGHVAGEVASKMAVQAIKDYIQQLEQTPADRELLLSQAVAQANTLIFQLAASREDYAGMGTTVSMVYLNSASICWGHVGDSRIYLLRDNELHQLTNDHSLVWELVQSGNITKAEAHIHPQRNMLTRAVGTSRTVKVDTGTTGWKRGDALLLCTDGLTNMLSEQEIHRIITSEHDDCETAVHELIASANRAGGLDNITAILLKNEDL